MCRYSIVASSALGTHDSFGPGVTSAHTAYIHMYNVYSSSLFEIVCFCASNQCANQSSPACETLMTS